MTNLLTISALLVSSLAMGQMPYNPDSNGDDLIGATDLISVLSLYNTLMVDSSLTCDYEGTELEELFIGLVDATLQLDSLYVEYLIYDTVSYYTPGCPDLVYEPVVLERAYMIPAFGFYASPDKIEVGGVFTYLNENRSFILEYFPLGNYWTMTINDWEIQEITSYSFRSYWSDAPNGNEDVSLPFPENWILDEDGIQVEYLPNSWATNCENLRLIPYWHYAE